MHHFRDDLDKYEAMWNKALEDGLFKDAPKPAEPARNVSFFGPNNNEPTNDLQDCDTEYWNNLYKNSFDSGNEGLISEETVPSKDDIKRTTEKMANAQNPVVLSSLGKDQEYAKIDDTKLQELIDLKLNLEKLEIKLNTDDALGKKTDVQSKIDGLKKQVDELSDSLNGNRFER